MDAIGRLAEQVVDCLVLQPGPLETTSWARVDDPVVVSQLCARALDLLALPASLATNTRLLNGESELPKHEWSHSRVGDGEVIHTELRNPHIDRAVSEGAMVVIDSVDEMDVVLMRFRESLEYRLSARAWINLYMTSGSTSNFGLHYDTHDTLILQLLGRKHWLVGDKSRPVGSTVDPGAEYPLRSVELTSGDVMAMPARALHNATGIGDFTLHLTIGFDRSAAVPYMIDEVAALLKTEAPSLTVEELELAKARIPERRRGTSLPFTAGHDLHDRAVVRWASRLPPFVDEAADARLRITSGSQDLVVQPEAEARVAMILAGGDEFSIEDLADRADAAVDETLRFVQHLASLDLVICRLIGE